MVDFVKKSYFSVLLMMIMSLMGSDLIAQHNITVNVANKLNHVGGKPVGINMNYLMDGSYLSPAISTQEAIKDLGAKFLRYPGGEKSDNYLWSVAPYDRSNPRFARTGHCEWPTADMRFANSDYTTMKPAVQDFDEFMAMCKSVRGVPLIVVPYDCMFKASTCNGTVPTREQLLTNAVEWVRYANKKMGYNIKYWMIGNESYTSCNYNGCATAAQYKLDIIEFSTRMKAVDPTIKIIANGDGAAWWSAVLPGASAHIDYLGISNYPVYNFAGGYTYYKNSTPDFIGGVRNAVNAINAYSPAEHRSRIKIITTEYNAIDWTNQWANVNDLGHALASFEVLGQHLKSNKVAATIFWNTRWVDNVTKADDINDAIDKDGNLNANGMSFSIFAKNLLEKMVASSSTVKVRTFATYRQSTNQVTVFLINKETSAVNANLNISNYIANTAGDRWNLTGTGPGDLNPVWSKVGKVQMTGNGLALSLPPVSITMIRLSAGAVLADASLRSEGTDGVEMVSITPPEGEPVLNEKKERFEAFPNPAIDVIHVNINTAIRRRITLMAFSADGRQVYAKDIVNNPVKQDIDVRSWPKGVYILQLMIGDERIIKKIVVQ